jgi:aerobic-type carbon monoxide dehydrogenase small subunit (CoxS/CutS family)
MISRNSWLAFASLSLSVCGSLVLVLDSSVLSVHITAVIMERRVAVVTITNWGRTTVRISTVQSIFFPKVLKD